MADRSPSHLTPQERVHKLAVLRYLRLTELRADPAVLAKHGVYSNGDTRHPIDVEEHMVVPSRDVAAAWATDMLSPGSYARAGRPSDTTPAGEPAWYRHQHRRMLTLAPPAALSASNLSPSAFRTMSAAGGGVAGVTLASLAGVSVGAQCAAALLGWTAVRWHLDRRAHDHGSAAGTPTGTSALIDEWKAEYDATEALWQAENGSLYRQSIADLKEGKRVAGGTPTEVEEARLRNRLHQPVVGMARLTAGMASQAKFNRRILAMGPEIINEQWIKRAVKRYETFLQIAVRMASLPPFPPSPPGYVTLCAHRCPSWRTHSRLLFVLV